VAITTASRQSLRKRSGNRSRAQSPATPRRAREPVGTRRGGWTNIDYCFAAKGLAPALEFHVLEIDPCIYPHVPVEITVRAGARRYLICQHDKPRILPLAPPSLPGRRPHPWPHHCIEALAGASDHDQQRIIDSTAVFVLDNVEADLVRAYDVEPQTTEAYGGRSAGARYRLVPALGSVVGTLHRVCPDGRWRAAIGQILKAMAALAQLLLGGMGSLIKRRSWGLQLMGLAKSWRNKLAHRGSKVTVDLSLWETRLACFWGNIGESNLGTMLGGWSVEALEAAEDYRKTIRDHISLGFNNWLKAVRAGGKEAFRFVKARIPVSHAVDGAADLHLHPAQMAAEVELDKWIGIWMPEEVPPEPQWPPLGDLLPAITPCKLVAACLRFPWGTGFGSDAMHPRHLAALGETSMRWMCILMTMFDSLGRLPSSLRSAHLARLSKPEGDIG
jgi:hypothetical protein